MRTITAFTVGAAVGFAFASYCIVGAIIHDQVPGITYDREARKS